MNDSITPNGVVDPPNSDPYISNDFYPLNEAHRKVLSALRSDETSADADLYRRIASYGSSTNNGTMGSSYSGQGHLYHYFEDVGGNDSTIGFNGRRGIANGITPPPDISTSPIDTYHTLRQTHSIPLPTYLTNVLKETKLTSLMGIFEEANIVWISVDDALYLWEYGSGDGMERKKEDFVHFKVPSGHCIVSVGLVKPKVGVFKDVVEWSLVVTTPEEAILCALAREPNNISMQTVANTSAYDSLLRLIPTRYVIPTDSVPILTICGSNDGRIFMGGYDGSLFEMTYEGLISPKSAQYSLDRSDDNYYPDSDTTGPSIASSLASGGKRAFSTLLFGPSSATSSEQRPRKCRKINHTALAPPLVSAFIPGFVLRTASAVFGSSPSIRGGPITELTLDKDRRTLYALTSFGYIHAFDLDTGGGDSLKNSPPRLACSINVLKSVRRYLDCVAHGRAYPPPNGMDSSIAAINFPGGGAGAQAGVGGMDGARTILKVADTDLERLKNSRSRGDEFRKRRKSPGFLHPMTIQIVPPSESKCLTLLAISSGGLRYYLSVLPDAGTRVISNSLKPGHRFSLCHVRAPPPFSIDQNNKLSLDPCRNALSGVSPGIEGIRQGTKGDATKSLYASGVTLLAIDTGGSGPTGNEMGESIIALTPDYTDRRERSGLQPQIDNGTFRPTKNTGAFPPECSGVDEIVSLPTVHGSSGSGKTTIPGGRVWDLAVTSFDTHMESSSIRNLFFQSRTPSDGQINEGLLPEYLPPSRRNGYLTRLKRNGVNEPVRSSVEAARASSQQNGVVSTAIKPTNDGLISLSLNLLRSMLLSSSPFGSRPNVNTPSEKIPSYTISTRVGCKGHGFSSTAKARQTSSSRLHSTPNSRSFIRSNRRNTGAKASRILPCMLKPASVPLAEMASQHLLIKSKQRKFVALNSGGLNFFSQTSPLEKFKTALTTSKNNSNIGRDETIKSFFKRYGYTEGCAMCLTIAIREENNELVRKAVQTAINFANRPMMVPAAENIGETTDTSNLQQIPARLSNENTNGSYEFQPSSLHDGLLSLVSRLLRPIWCKPAIVVTEGKVIPPSRRGENTKILPAKVELLLDEVTLQDIRRPLASLQILIRDLFPPAVNVVPGGKQAQRRSDSTVRKDVSNGEDFITRAIRYQSQTPLQNNSESRKPSENDLKAMACLKEERSLHSLYRLVSRTVQALHLLSRLRHAHLTPELPEVEFGLLHGLTFSQFITMKNAQDRIETVLTHLFSSNQAMTSSEEYEDKNTISSVESNTLSTELSRQCYLFFSIGSRLTYLGFQTALSAMSQPPSSSMRIQHAKNASSYLRRAAKHWYNPSLVIGRSLRDEESFVSAANNKVKSDSKYENIVSQAMECGSPLYRAASVLMELQDVAGVVDVCLVCASNFGGQVGGQQGVESDLSSFNDGASTEMMSWEKGLYHRAMGEDPPFDDNRTASNSQLIRISRNDSNQSNSSTETTHSDARFACYAILFYHLGTLLKSASHISHNHFLAEEMVSVAISSPDLKFHHELYEYLTKYNYVDTMLRIQCPNLEKWLKEYKKDSALLRRYYIINGFDWMAGDIMWKRGISGGEEKISLEERIECLTRAVSSFSAALKSDTASEKLDGNRQIYSSSSTPSKRFIRQMSPSPSRDEISQIILQINDKIDIAKLQNRILSTIRSSKNASKLDASKLESLSFTLVNVSILYGDFAVPLELFDLCLLILQTCRYDDTSRIITLWRSILCEEVLPCQTNSREAHNFLYTLQKGSISEKERILLTADNVSNEDGELMVFEDGDWVASLKNRVVSLGKEVHGKEADYFPLEFLAESLEGLEQRLKIASSGKHSTPWSLSTIIESGASYRSIFDAYDSMIEKQNNEPGAKLDPVTRLAQLSSSSEALMHWVSSVSSKDSGGMMIGFGRQEESARIQLIRYSAVLLPKIDSYKEAIESLVGCNNDDLSRVYARLSNAEDILRRQIMN